MTQFSRRAFGLGSMAFAGAALVGLPAAAQANLSAEDQATVQRMTDWFQAMTAARGTFTETGPNGQARTGTFYLQRPGKMRFEYSNPAGLVVVSDGNNVMRHDPRLNTFRQVPLSQTPLSVFLGREIRLDRGVRIDRVVRMQTGAFAVHARDARRPNEGSVVLAFAGEPARLREWTITDAQGARTRTVLNTLEPASGLSNSLFTLRDPTRRPGRN